VGEDFMPNGGLLRKGNTSPPTPPTVPPPTVAPPTVAPPTVAPPTTHPTAISTPAPSPTASVVDGSFDDLFPTSDPNVVTIVDLGFPDVGMPDAIKNAGFQLSGWDIREVRFKSDHNTDTMHIGISCYAICGDADGDGDGGRTSSALATMGGIDEVDFSGA